MRVAIPIRDARTLELVATATYTGTVRAGRLRFVAEPGQKARTSQLRAMIVARQDLRTVAFAAPRSTRQRGWSGLYGNTAALARVAAAITLVLGWGQVEWPPNAEGPNV